MLGGTPHFNLRRLGELRGERSARNIVLVTTMWDKFSRKADNEEREDDLKAGYWNIMMQQGATVDRFENSSTSAWAIVDKIVALHNDGAYRSKRLFQDKMRNLERIAAGMFHKKAKGKALYRYLQTLLDGRNDIDVNAEIEFLIQVESKLEEILQEPPDGMRLLLNTQFSIFLENYFAQQGERPFTVNSFPSQMESRGRGAGEWTSTALMPLTFIYYQTTRTYFEVLKTQEEQGRQSNTGGRYHCVSIFNPFLFSQ